MLALLEKDGEVSGVEYIRIKLRTHARTLRSIPTHTCNFPTSRMFHSLEEAEKHDGTPASSRLTTAWCSLHVRHDTILYTCIILALVSSYRFDRAVYYKSISVSSRCKRSCGSSQAV